MFRAPTFLSNRIRLMHSRTEMEALLWGMSARVARRSVPAGGSNSSTVSFGRRSRSYALSATPSAAANALPKICASRFGLPTAVLAINRVKRPNLRILLIGRQRRRQPGRRRVRHHRTRPLSTETSAENGTARLARPRTSVRTCPLRSLGRNVTRGGRIVQPFDPLRHWVTIRRLRRRAGTARFLTSDAAQQPAYHWSQRDWNAFVQLAPQLRLQSHAQ